MTRRMVYLLSSVVAIIAPIDAIAATIHFTFSASGAGSLGGQVFPDSNFQIIAVGDVHDRSIVFSDSDVIVYSVPHASAEINIEGVGSAKFLVPTRTFYGSTLVSGRSSIVGFGWGPNGRDLIGMQNDGVFILPPWDMSISIGPLSFLSALMQWSADTVATDKGTLEFDLQRDVPTTFAASVVPIPSALSFLCIGLLGMLPALFSTRARSA